MGSPADAAAQTAAAGPAARGLRVAEAVAAFLVAVEDGRVLNRSGRPYKPGAIRDVRGCLRGHVVPDLGHMALRDVRRRHIQALVDRLAADGLSLSRIRSVVSALRALYGYAIAHGQVEFNPVDELALPRPSAPRDAAPRVSEAEPRAEAEADRARSWADHARRRSAPDLQPLAALPDGLLTLIVRSVVVCLIVVVLVIVAAL